MKTAIIAAGGRGIGAAVAQRLSADGWVVAVAYLLSDDASYVTGQSLRVDGGLTRHV